MNLVTGGTGLVGAHLLLHLLQNGEKVKALFRTENSIIKTKKLFKRFNQNDLFHQIEWVEGDVNNIPSLEIAFENIDSVYHCAALISFDSRDEARLRKVNIEGTANMVNLALAFGVNSFCYVSSIAALGDLGEHETIITEETEWNPEKPHSDYALSKYGAEMEIWRAQQEGLNCVIVNPGVILGSSFWDKGSGEIFTKIANGLPFYTEGSTGFVAVEDVVEIMYKLLKSGIKGERFTVIAENIDFKTLSFCIADNLKVKRPLFHAKSFYTSLYWRIDWIIAHLFFQPRKFSKATAKSLHTKDLYSNKKVVDTLQYSFRPIKEYCDSISLAFLQDD